MSGMMRAVAVFEPLPADDPRALRDVTLPAPGAPRGRELLVEVRAVSVNPLDTKVRRQAYGGPNGKGGGPRILGWDAAGVVLAAGEEATLFRPGDAVMYAGRIDRPGCHAERQLVDERIVGPKPAALDFDAAAALPLATITACEALIERMGIDRDGLDAGRRLLVIGGAGGVGSMAIQIGRRLGLEVVATASRPESGDWCRRMGARHVIDHRRPLAAGLRECGLGEVEYVFDCASLDEYWTQMAEVVAPRGALCSIVANERPVDLKAIMRKGARFAWEAMFSRAVLDLPDMIEQHRLLARIAGWIDAGELRGTMTERLGPISAATLLEAHRRIEARRMIGKVVVAGWSPAGAGRAPVQNVGGVP